MKIKKKAGTKAKTMVKTKGKAKDKWDFMQLGQTVPGPQESLEVLAPTKKENACTL